MAYSFILLSAGKGTRFGKETPKQYLLFAGKPMIVHTLERIEKIDEVEEIIIVCGAEYVERIKTYASNYKLSKKIVFVEGGATRQQSVYNGLRAAACANVILHEAARPLVSTKDFLALIASTSENVSYTYGIPYTVLKKDQENRISGILERTKLVNIQLPQKFNKKDIMCAHEKAVQEGKSFTEDASMVYYYTDKPVACMNGKSYNVKMTEYADLLYGEMLLKEGLFKEEEI